MSRQPSGSHRNEFDEVNGLGLWDWRIAGMEGHRLTLEGSMDFSYYHQAEVVFHEVDFLSCPTHLHHAFFRRASEDERAQFASQTDWEGDMFCIVTEHGDDSEGPRYFVCAGRVEIRIGTVYYYRRDNLQPGERIAPWVK